MSKKNWIAFNFGCDTKQSATAVSVKNTSKCSEKVSSASKVPFNFMVKVSPKKICDLAVHSKKIKEVETWLQNNVLNTTSNVSTPLLVITGPTGSGKTATVTVLCRELGIQVSEWINPIDQDYELSGGSGQTAKLVEFLTQTKYASLLDSRDKRIGLVEDFPNSVIYKPSEFFDVLEKVYYKAKCPIIFICTEETYNSLNLPQKLFPQEIREKYGIANISYNSCSVTLLKNALKRVQNIIQERKDIFNVPAPETVDAITTSSCGDIRCAMNQFYFACLKGTTELSTEANKKKSTKRKRSLTSDVKLKYMNKDESLTLFHGVGRVLNPKRIESSNSWRLDCDFDLLIDTFSSQPKSFVAFLHENYLKYYGDVEDVQKAMDSLSLSNLFMDKWSEKQEMLTYGLWVSVLGLMVFNEHKVSKWTQITKPTKVDKNVSQSCSEREINVLDRCYYDIINKL